MNRFLKKEWDSAEIPEALRLGARNRAWSRLHPPPATAENRWIWVGAAAAILLAIVVSQRPAALKAPEPTLPIAARSVEPYRLIRPELPSPSAPLSATAAEAARAAGSARVPDKLAAGPLRNDAARPEEIAPSPPRTQLTSTFKLAKTGVRMIWVQDAEFLKETGDSP